MLWGRHSASLSLGLICTLPLWLLYEGGRLHLGTELPLNGAEAALFALFRAMGSAGPPLLRLLAGLLVAGSALLLLRRQVPLFRLAPLVIGEGFLWGCLIGPLGLLVARGLALGPASFWPQGFFCAIGAGLYEELAFRLFLLSLLQLLLAKVCRFHDLPPLLAPALAILVSGLLFALAHHLAPGTPAPGGWVFLFRSVMGVLLGVLFVLRGFGVVVYAHTWYDMIIYLDQS